MPSLISLSAPLPLTKTFARSPSGSITKTPYPMVWRFSSQEHAFQTIEDLAKIVVDAATQQHCLLKGEIDKPILNESRAGRTDPLQPTQWVLLDFDKAAAESLDDLLAALGLADVDHFVQYSASHGLPGTEGTISAHVFMLLDQPVAPDLLKAWLIRLNMLAYKDQLRLNRLGTALVWPLDITTCQNDKLIYVAAPTFEGMEDPLKRRFRLCKRTQRHIPHRRIVVDADLAAFEQRKRELLHDLRKAAGMPKLRDTWFKTTHSGVEYLERAGKHVLSGMKIEREFRYFNLNGGDSWAYYQPINDFEYVYNFKGEPALLLKEIAPEFYASLAKDYKPKITPTTETKRFAFYSPVADTYFNAEFNKEENTLVANPCASEGRVRQYLKTRGMEHDPIYEYNLVFDPQNPNLIDNSAAVINTYRAPVFPKQEVTQVPPQILRVIVSAVGEGEIQSWFFKWLRAIVIERSHTGKALILHGEPSTGKGVLFNRILTPLVGASNAKLIAVERLLEQYNGWLENTLLVGIDEAETEALGHDARRVEATMKSWITEPTVMIRTMRQNPRLVRNYASFILMSNQPSPQRLTDGDRRYQVGRYQPQKIVISPDDIAEIDASVGPFFNWLSAQPAASESEIRAVLNTDDRDKLIDLGKTTIDSVTDALRRGDMSFLFGHLPHLGGSALDNVDLMHYKAVLKRVALRAANSPEMSYIAREELSALIGYLAGNIRSAPHHFTTLLKHKRVHLSPVTPDGRPGACMHVKWAHDKEWILKNTNELLADIKIDAPAPVKQSRDAA